MVSASTEQPTEKSKKMKSEKSTATLTNYETGEAIRPATAEELAASIEAAKTDGGAGVIEVDGVSCYVQE